MKQIEEEVYNKESFLQDLVEGKEHHTLSYKTNTSILNIMSDIRSFGEVRIEAKPCNIVLIKKKARQAQLTVPIVSTKSIENIKLTTHKTIDTQGDFIHGCCMLSDGIMAFSHHDDKTVRVINDKGSKDFEVEMPCHPFDIVYISGNNTLAVTSGSSVMMGIYIIDLGTKQIMKTISLNSYIDGIKLNGNQLIYSGRDNGIQMISLEDESIHDIVRDKMPVYCYIATLRDNIYYTNYITNTVTCYNLQGKLQWLFLNESVLNNHHGIDVNKDGNVYVTRYISNNVVAISPDGQRHREILTANDGLSHPIAIHYNGSNNQLLVANLHNNNAFLFNCT